LYETLEKMILDRRIRFKLDQQLDKFKKAQGLFGRSMTIDTRDKKQPGIIFFFQDFIKSIISQL